MRRLSWPHAPARLASWNVNGLRAVTRKGELAPYIEERRPDVLCLQETRVHPEQLDPAITEGWHCTWAVAQKKGYSGVSTWCREAPDEARIGLGDPLYDDEGRTVLTRHGDVWLINGYFPNGQRDHARVSYKLDYTLAVLAEAERLRRAGFGVVFTGDLNTAHHPIDLKNAKGNKKTTGFLPIERFAFDAFEALGWVDAFRALHPGLEGQYSWWSNRSGARARNVGWRIDYHWVSAELWPRVKAAGIRPAVMGPDHCPIELDLE